MTEETLPREMVLALRELQQDRMDGPVAAHREADELLIEALWVLADERQQVDVNAILREYQKLPLPE